MNAVIDAALDTMLRHLCLVVEQAITGGDPDFGDCQRNEERIVVTLGEQFRLYAGITLRLSGNRQRNGSVWILPGLDEASLISTDSMYKLEIERKFCPWE